MGHILKMLFTHISTYRKPKNPKWWKLLDIGILKMNFMFLFWWSKKTTSLPKNNELCDPGILISFGNLEILNLENGNLKILKHTQILLNQKHACKRWNMFKYSLFFLAPKQSVSPRAFQKNGILRCRNLDKSQNPKVFKPNRQMSGL